MKEKIFSFIEAQRDLVVELERSLTRIPALAPESGGEGELDKCLFLESFLRAQGFDHFERLDIPDVRAKGGIRPNLLLTIPGIKSSPAFWVITHIDVVPPGDRTQWNSDPWSVVEKDGKLYGRGVEDNQQGLVSSVLAALALVKNGITPSMTLKLLFVSDEECGNGYGIDALVKRDRERAARQEATLFHSGDMALIPDGGDPEGATIEIAEKNIAWCKFTTKGKQTHGSRPDQGANAFLAGSALALKLHAELTHVFNAKNELFEPCYSTFQPTKKEANIPNINAIPGEDVFYMDARILPIYGVDPVLAEIGRIIKETEKDWGVSIAYELVQRTESRPTSADAPIVTLLAKTIESVLGVKPRPIGTGGGTAGAFLRNIGIDAAVWSKLDDTAHNPNEYAVIDNILDGAKVIAMLLA